MDKVTIKYAIGPNWYTALSTVYQVSTATLSYQ